VRPAAIIEKASAAFTNSGGDIKARAAPNFYSNGLLGRRRGHCPRSSSGPVKL